ncbi:SSD1 [Candida pseudojiufengensis]|uniref:SSD1 n=1 Tax=Candida pseudojiufengensis TaxID=497109 RepID=UPI00222507C2|nr:SSD1 [Candida pseudojiufengensis]KAI5958703.1 SSD1 [Candida pseudojiufengensis]
MNQSSSNSFNNNNNNSNINKNDQSEDIPTRVSSRKGKNLHVAHRRSPSELTTLMVEQYNLQRQLDQVQAQQKQILEQQQQQQQQQQHQVQQHQYPQQPSYPDNNWTWGVSSENPNTINNVNNSNNATGNLNRGSHSRSSSINTHRRTGSASGTAHGHSRRHSLALNEAIAAADHQRTNRSTTSPKLQHNSDIEDDSTNNNKPGSFKFPPDKPNEPSSPTFQAAHNRSRSMAYGQNQPSFKFPAQPSDNSNNLLPPTPNFSITQSPERGGSHNRRASHFRTQSRNSEGMNQNWRGQQQSPQQLQTQHHNQQQQHQRQSSTLEPPGVFIPGHRPRNSSYGGGSSVSSLSHFLPNIPVQPGSQPTSGSNNGRKSLFAPYLPQSSLPELINEGRLVTGTLRVNKKNRSDAYVSTDGLLDADIFICGSKDRNRALEGDLVAVELLIVDEVWESKKEKEEKKRRKDHNTRPLNDDIHNDATSAPITSSSDKDDKDDESLLGRRGSLKQRPTMKKNDDVEVEGQSLLLVEEEEINDEIKPLYAGHVVAVVDRIPGQLFSGTLGLLRPAQAAQAARDKKSGNDSSIHTPKSPKIVWFKPTDKKVPLIAIPTEQAPRDFVENHEKYADQLFVASIKRWPITSLHPFGTLVSKLGKIDDPEVEVDSILRDNNFLCDEYPEDDNDYVTYDIQPVESEFSNPNRIEYLNDYIIAFSQNGEFVDHALHVKRLSNTKIELGFHVADIAQFVKAGSTVDRKSKKRSTSIFLPQKSVHLYPKQVNNIVSFKENEKNLAISVVFEIDTTNFEVEDLFIHESIIIPKQIVSYKSFNKIMDNNKIEQISSATCDYLKTFSLIAKEFRRHRLSNKSLGISPNLSLLDQLDDEKVSLSLNIFDDNLASDIISEIGLKVNSAIAAKIQVGLGNKAFLRRQALPTLQKIESFVRKAKNLGFKIDTTNSASLQSCILKENLNNQRILETLFYKCSTRGKYFIAGKQDPDSYNHFYFNLPLFTHFTAPLRRYADLIVHRQLKSVLNKTNDDTDIESLKSLADYCNFKKDCAANAQEQSTHLLLSQTINGLSESAGQILCMGTIIQVYESSFDVFIPEIGVEKRVHGDQLPLVKAEFDKNNRVLELYWEKGFDSATYVPPDEKSLLSYRNSIKNKYRTSSLQAAKIQNRSILENNNNVFTTDSIVEKLNKLNLEVPEFVIPQLKNNSNNHHNHNKSHNINNQDPSTKSMPTSPIQSHAPKNPRTNSSTGFGDLNEEPISSTTTNTSHNNTNKSSSSSGLTPYIQNLELKQEGDYNIQIIRELNEIPVLLRAEIGMTLPCLSVRCVNPFM